MSNYDEQAKLRETVAYVLQTLRNMDAAYKEINLPLHGLKDPIKRLSDALETP